MFNQPTKSLIIVHNSDTKQCAEFLSGLIVEKKYDSVSLNAVIMNVKEFSNLAPEGKTAQQYILYLGTFPESKIASKNISKWRLDRFGFRYGWHGRKAVIRFDETKISKETFNDLTEFAAAEFKKHGIDVKVPENADEASFWENPDSSTMLVAGIAASAAIFALPVFAATYLVTSVAGRIAAGGIAAGISKSQGDNDNIIKTDTSNQNKKKELTPSQMKEQQQFLAMLLFYYSDLNEFWGLQNEGV